MEDILNKLADYIPLAVAIAAGIIAGVILKFIIVRIIRMQIKKEDNRFQYMIKKHFKKTSYFFLHLIFITIFSLFVEKFPIPRPDYFLFLRILLIITGTWFFIRAAYLAEDFLIIRFDISKKDNFRERKIVTQLGFIKKLVIIALLIIAVTMFLYSFEAGRKLGTVLITSAGLTSIIIGLAAQKSLGNLIAGFQIAFTQPIRIEDAVLVEGEWGWIEEITLTYVVVKIWDWRRLVLPITYFIEKPFQNWTRTDAALIGSVFIYLDYKLPVDNLRQKVKEILDGEENWDKNVWGLSVVDVNQETVVCRAIMTAANSGQAWDLRCSVREKIIRYIAEEYPQYLPRTRVNLERDDKKEYGGSYSDIEKKPG